MWGKYRRTLARIPAGTGEGRAAFTARLPAAGRWRLYYHLPGASLSHGHQMREYKWWEPADSFGSMDIKIVGAEPGDTRTVTFDGAEATPGWNSLSVYDRPAGPVQVVVSDRTSGDIVVADAVRWSPVDGR